MNNGMRGSFYITAEAETAIAQTYKPAQAMLMLTGAANPEANARLIAEAPAMADFTRRVAEYFSETDAPLGDEALAILKRIGAP